jgi:small-conductance mechanosensitive channel
MRGFLVSTAESLGLGVANAIPGLFTAVVIFLITRFLTRVVGLWFTAVEQGRVKARYIHPETALPTRRILTALLWLFAFGSSGIVNQIMSGFMITYSRALRLGDYVKIGDIEGTVMHMGVLSVKIKSLWREEITVPNAVVVAQTTIDYTRLSSTEGVATSTSVTIGYDSPWRQIHALLLKAAEQTPGIRRDPEPVVFQMGLEDFYVKYTLYYCLERQEARYIVLTKLHARIQDQFNEHGVQIMSPNYVLDPKAPKIVPKQDWFAPPAAPRSERSGS